MLSFPCFLARILNTHNSYPKTNFPSQSLESSMLLTLFPHKYIQSNLFFFTILKTISYKNDRRRIAVQISGSQKQTARFLPEPLKLQITRQVLYKCDSNGKLQFSMQRQFLKLQRKARLLVIPHTRNVDLKQHFACPKIHFHGA